VLRLSSPDLRSLVVQTVEFWAKNLRIEVAKKIPVAVAPVVSKLSSFCKIRGEVVLGWHWLSDDPSNGECLQENDRYLTIT
jgi:hypothetical protein